MDNSLLVSLSQQLASYRSMDVIANNLANISTPGFKREAAKFEEYVAQCGPSETRRARRRQLRQGCGRGARPERGRIEPPARRYDVAINGKGYFVVQTPNGSATPATAISASTSDGQLVTGGWQCRCRARRRDHRHAR